MVKTISGLQREKTTEPNRIFKPVAGKFTHLSHLTGTNLQTLQKSARRHGDLDTGPDGSIAAIGFDAEHVFPCHND